MSLSVAFQMASTKTHKKPLIPARKSPHSKTFAGNTIPSSSEIDEIGETEEENFSENEDSESQQNTSQNELSQNFSEIPNSKDFISKDQDYQYLSNWNFDITNIGDLMEKYRLIGTMFTSLGYVERFEIDLTVFGRFLHSLQEKYNVRKNPFHNFDHGFTVCHATFFMIKNKLLYEYFDEIDGFALLFSALCHDVDHTGRTNGFEVASYSNLALKHNDESVN